MFEMHCVIKKFLVELQMMPLATTSMNYHRKQVNLPSHFLFKIETNAMETYDMLKVPFGEQIKILGGVSKFRNR